MGQTSRGIVYPSNYSAVADVPADLQIMAQSIDDILQEDEQNIQNNSDDIATIQENVSAHEQSIQDNTTDINTLKNQVQSFALVSETGNKVEIEINSLTYVMKIILKDKNNNVINTSNEIDLPLETMVVGARYDSSTKELVLTLKNGQETRFSIADLIDGLVSQSDFDDLAEIVGTNTETIENNTSAIANNMKDIKQNEEDIDAITKLIDTEFDTNTAEGTTIDVDDSAEWDGSIGVGGNTEQKQLSGKNKINTFAQKSTVVEGITVSVDEDGIVTLNGTCTRNNTGVDLNQIIQGDGKTYTLKAEIVDGTYSKPSSDLRFNFHVLSSGYNYEGLSQQFGEANSVNKTLIAGHEYDVIGFRVDLGIVLNNLRVKVQLEEGDTATEYEPYCGGQPSPNPDYPQEKKVVKGANVIKHVGKNICPVKQVNGSKNGLNWIVNDDGTILINGTATVQSVIPIHNEGNNIGLNIKLKDNTDYVISNGANGNSATFGFQCGYKIAGGTTVWSEVFNNKKITTTKDWVLGVGVLIRSGVTMNNVLIKPMIEEGTIPTSYEPYREEEYIVDLGSDNIIDYNKNVENFYYNELGAKTYNGNYTFINEKKISYPNANYNFSFDNKVGDINTTLRICEYNKNNEFIKRTIITENNHFTTTEETAYIIYSIDKSSSRNFVEPVLTREGTQSIELCKIGDYQDYLYKENGNWYKYEAITKKVFDGSETWDKSAVPNTVNTTRYATQIGVNTIITGISICDKFINRTPSMPAGDYECLLISNNVVRAYIQLNIDRIQSDTVEDFKKWLSNNNVIAYCVLVTPVITKITDPTLISQLEELLKVQMYHGVNHFYVETDNLEPVMELTYKQSNKIQMQKEIEDLKNAIISMGGNV